MVISHPSFPISCYVFLILVVCHWGVSHGKSWQRLIFFRLYPVIKMACKWRVSVVCVLFIVGIVCCDTAKPHSSSKWQCFCCSSFKESLTYLWTNKRVWKRNTSVWLWRWRNQICLGKETTPKLVVFVCFVLFCFFQGKDINRFSVSALIWKTFDKGKSGGCKKLQNHTTNSYAGFSERETL